MAQVAAPSSNELAQQRTSMATARTSMASGRTSMASTRTLLAWVRTGLSMIGFGFTIYKFLQAFVGQGVKEGAPREIGLFLITLGTLAIAFGCIDFWQEMKEAKAATGKPLRKFPLILAALTGGLGVLLIIRILIGAS